MESLSLRRDLSWWNLTFPTLIASSQDTSTAVLWAGSTSPFSEKKELPLGPIYGFVDKWANLLALPGNVTTAAYSDSGVPRISNESIYDVIPNYDATYSSIVTSILGKALKNSSAWRMEWGRDGFVSLRIPGLAARLTAELELFDLGGKKIGAWNLRTETGYLRWSVAGIRPGAYLLKVRVNGAQGLKRIML